MWHDPHNLQWRPRAGAPLAARVEQRLARLRTASTLWMLGRSMAETFDRFGQLAPMRAFGSIDRFTVGDRRPLVLAHGPSLSAILQAIRKHRDRLFVIAPMRTALHLAAHKIWVDLAVLADRGTTPYAVTETAWAETPSATTERLRRAAAILIEPFAPVRIYEGFGRIAVLDDGTGLSGGGTAVPFWGNALIAGVAVPLALGAHRVAVGGIDLKGAAGRPRATWRGEPTRIDARYAALLGVLEVLASGDRELVDVSPDSVSKRGFRCEPLDRYARRAALPLVNRESAAASPTLTTVVTDLLGRFEELEPIVESMRAAARRGLELLDQPDSIACREQLEVIVDTMERRWPQDERFSRAITVMQPGYLMMLIELQKMNVQPVNPSEAVRRKARLMCAELDGLAADYRLGLAAARATVAHLRSLPAA
jgi:hypothetical protein